MTCNEFVLYQKMGTYKKNTKSMWTNVAMTEVESVRKQEGGGERKKKKKRPNG
jgi:hypothetical protein